MFPIVLAAAPLVVSSCVYVFFFVSQTVNDITTNHIPTAILADGITQGFISSLNERATKATTMREIFE